MTNNRYRRGVGVMLLNREGKVFVGARIDNTDEAWQMPQGGIDKGEEPWATALRELEEETGIPPRLVERISACPERLKYDLPDDSDVNIHTKHPEFRDWRWIEPDQLPDLIVPFKRDLYRRLLREFAEHL
jgi:putative (di)nucleoside polyphosphate hydrolase